MSTIDLIPKSHISLSEIAGPSSSKQVYTLSSEALNELAKGILSAEVKSEHIHLGEGEIFDLECDKHEALPGKMKLSPSSKTVQTMIFAFIAASRANYPGPKNASDIEVLNWLNDPERMTKGIKPRIEFRKVVGGNLDEIANIAFCFADTKSRDSRFQEFKSLGKNLSIVSAGSTTIEIGIEGVDKGTVIDYLARHLKEVLPHYQPGPLINALKHQSILCMDADGTLWEKPAAGQSPEANHLKNSPAREAILSYLRAGGIVAVISGNDPQRTINRFLKGVPKHERKELLSRVILSGAGGHTLMAADPSGKFQEVKGYRENTLKEQKNTELQKGLDIIYLGDDDRLTGNDNPGFEKVGEDRAVCVTKKNEAGKPESMIVRGETSAVKMIVEDVLAKAKLLHQKGVQAPLFSDLPSLRSTSRSKPLAQSIVDHTLKVLGRGGVNHVISYADENINAPVAYSREAIDVLLQTSKKMVSLKPDFDGIIHMSADLTERLKKQKLNPAQFRLVDNLRDPSKAESGKELVYKALDAMKLKDGDAVRFLEPGNNDQATPIYLGEQIQYVKDYEQEKGIKLSIQVLIMGQGGHPTSALFHQFAEVKGKDFSGVSEAESLGATLYEALKERSLNAAFDVKSFARDTSRIQIKLAKTSRNTGENVQEAIDETEHPPHVFIASARASSTRQALTFAAQYSIDRSDLLAPKKYSQITAIPYPRSRNFVEEAMNDTQAVVEMYAILAERARLYNYAYGQKPFIPAGPIAEEDLLDLYKVYDRLSGTNDLEKSKQAPITELQTFFSKQFDSLGNAITWTKEHAFQTQATKGSVKRLAENMRWKTDFKKSVILYKEITSKIKLDNLVLPEEGQSVLKSYQELREKAGRKGIGEREKKSCYILMGSMVNLLAQTAKFDCK